MKYIQESSKYAKWYNRLILNPNTCGYTERHHILPKSIFPEFSKDPDNIVSLSGRQHFIAHFLLMKHYKSISATDEYKKMSYAFMRMQKSSSAVNKNIRITSHTFEAMKKNFAVASSLTHKGKIISEETKEKMRGPRPSLKGRKHSKEHKENNSKARIGIQFSQKTKDKMSESQQKNRKMLSKLASQRTGSKNPRAKVKTVYNESGEVMFICHGNLKSTCEDQGLPYFALNKSFQQGGTPIYSTPQWETKAKSLGLEKFIGWYSN